MKKHGETLQSYATRGMRVKAGPHLHKLSVKWGCFKNHVDEACRVPTQPVLLPLSMPFS